MAPANVAILGGGVVGTNAAKIAHGMGAHVTIIDRNLNRLRELDDIFNGMVVTLASNTYTIAETLRHADLVIGGVLIPGASAPKLVRREMISRMKRGSVVVDVAIDQGGCFETSQADYPYRSDLFRGQRAALLRLEYAGRGAAYVHSGADQRHLPVSSGTGEQGARKGLRGKPGPALPA